MELKLNEYGQVLMVEQKTELVETPFDEDEIKRQIEHHSNVVNDLQAKLEAVQAFKAKNIQAETVEVKAVAEPLIDMVRVAEMVKIVKPVEEPIKEPVIIEEIITEKK